MGSNFTAGLRTPPRRTRSRRAHAPHPRSRRGRPITSALSGGGPGWSWPSGTLSVAGAVIVVRLPAIYRRRPRSRSSRRPTTRPSPCSSRKTWDATTPSRAKVRPQPVGEAPEQGLAEKVSATRTRAARDRRHRSAQELVDNLRSRPIPKSDYIIVTLEGTDPERTAKQLNKLLEIFRDEAEGEKTGPSMISRRDATDSLDEHTKELEALDKSINEDLTNSKIIAPGEKNILADRYGGASRSSCRSSSPARGPAAIQPGEVFPSLRDRNSPSARDAELAELHKTPRAAPAAPEDLRQTIREFDQRPRGEEGLLQLARSSRTSRAWARPRPRGRRSQDDDHRLDPGRDPP